MNVGEVLDNNVNSEGDEEEDETDADAVELVWLLTGLVVLTGCNDFLLKFFIFCFNITGRLCQSVTLHYLFLQTSILIVVHVVHTEVVPHIIAFMMK